MRARRNRRCARGGSSFSRSAPFLRRRQYNRDSLPQATCRFAGAWINSRECHGDAVRMAPLRRGPGKGAGGAGGAEVDATVVRTGSDAALTTTYTYLLMQPTDVCCRSSSMLTTTHGPLPSDCRTRRARGGAIAGRPGCGRRSAARPRVRRSAVAGPASMLAPGEPPIGGRQPRAKSVKGEYARRIGVRRCVPEGLKSMVGFR